jgi:ABC-type branched-subunit amino acid transport system substrate-binding protein
MKYLFLLLVTTTLQAKNDCIKIGILGEYKRPTARTVQPFGVEIKRGVDLALEDIKNLKPCVKVELLDIENSAANIPDVIKVAHQKKNIHLFLGLGTTDQALAAIPALRETKTLLITPTASSDDLLKDNSRILMLFPRNSHIAEETIKEILRKNIQHVGIIYAENNRYSENMAKEFSKLYKEQGGKVIYSIPVRSGHIDLNTQLETLTKYKSTYVFLPLFELDVAKVISYLHSKKLSLSYIGADSWGTYSVVIRKVTKEIPYRAIVPIIYSPSQSSELNNIFVSKYEKLYKTSPSDFTAFSYEGIRLYQKMLAFCNEAHINATPEACLAKAIPYQGISHVIKHASQMNVDRPIQFMEHRNLAE